MKTTKLWILLPILMTVASVSFAQDEKKAEGPPRYYHLDYVVKEISDGKTVNSRVYSTIVSTDRGAPSYSLRTGTKVPVPQGANQFTYMDVGVSIDTRRVSDGAGRLMLNVSADISSLPGEVTGYSQVSPPPVVRNNRWTSDVVVPIGKPIIIFSSDDVTNKGKLQLELTATPIN
jgi:hypothetical protein